MRAADECREEGGKYREKGEKKTSLKYREKGEEKGEKESTVSFPL